jgi:hypothetical protein
MTKLVDKYSDKIWFIYDHDMVRGPYSAQEVSVGVAQRQFLGSDLIWGRTQKQWLKVEVWSSKHGGSMSTQENTNTTLAVEDQNDVWYIAFDGMNHGPFTQSAVVEKLRKSELNLACKVWTNGLTQWVGVHEVPELIEQLGISRRRHTRAPFVGSITVEGVDFSLATLSVSEGGVSGRIEETVKEDTQIWDAVNTHAGQLPEDKMETTRVMQTHFATEDEVTQIWSEKTYVPESENGTFKVGQEVEMIIQSPLLPQPIKAKAQVVYRQSNDLGFKFLQVSDEARLVVLDYVRQFEIAG